MRRDMDPGEGRDRGRLAPPRARLGVIIPSSNRLIEPQFQHFAPVALGVHFARARMTGRWSRPLAELAPDIVRAAQSLADARPDLILFNCAATSMKEGPQGDAYLLDLIHEASGAAAISTAGAVVEAFKALSLRRLTLVTPYVQKTNDHEKAFFHALGFEIVHDVALGLGGGDDYIQITPERQAQIAKDADHAAAQGCFMSCTNTSQIEAIEAIEAAIGKPAVSANQAALWAALRRLAPLLGAAQTCALPGRLSAMATGAPAATWDG